MPPKVESGGCVSAPSLVSRSSAARVRSFEVRTPAAYLSNKLINN